MARLKKFLAVSTLFITVLSMSVVVAPQAKAASAGDLIKMDGLSSVYYLGSDGKRYVFPNEATYFSWYRDFSSVVTISQSELEALPLGANVTIRPGTKLVKITTNPKVYAVTAGGNLLAIPDEATAKALYGDNWAKKVVDVPDAFFTNYKISANTVSSSAYPAGSLVKFGTSPDVYYIDDAGNARKIASEAAFLANRFSWDDVQTSTMTVPATGAEITGADSTLIDTASGAGGTIYTGGTGVVVALSSDTMASTNLPSKSTLIPFVTVNLTASNDGAITVNDMTFTRFGTGASTEFNGGYLYNGDTRLSTKRSVNSSDNKITFSNLGFSIPAGATKSVTLKMDANAGSTGSHSFRIAQASDVSASGATVSGSFPVAGNMMTYSNVQAATVTLTGSLVTQNKKVGETNVILGEYTIANNDKEEVNIARIRLKQNGDAGNGAVGNMSLDLDGTIVKSGVSMSDRYVDFILDTPFKLAKSKNITATVRGDILTDINKTVELYLSSTVDLEAKGTAYGTFYSAYVDNNVTTGWVAGNVYKTTIQGSNINVSFDGPSAADIKKNTTNNVFAYFLVKSENEDVNIETLPITITMSLASTSAALSNVEMVDVNGNGSYSPTSDPTGAATPETITFENVYLKKGVQYKFAIQGDTPDYSNLTGFTYKVGFTTTGLVGRYVANDVTVNATDFSASTLTGQTFTVAAPSVTFSKIALNNGTVVKSAQKVTLYRGKITASQVDDLRVSRLKISTSTTVGISSISDEFDRIYLYKTDADGNEVALLDDETSLSGNVVTFSGFTLDVPKGINGTQYYAVKGDVKSSPVAGSISFKLSGTASDFTVRDSDSNSLASGQFTIDATEGPVLAVGGTGSYTVTMDTNEAGINVAKNVLAGTRVLLGRLKFTATNENALVKDLLLRNEGNAIDLDMGNVYLYKEKEMTTLFGGTSMGSTGYAFFQGLNGGAGIEVSTVGVTYVYIAADIKGIDYSSSPAASATARAEKTIALEATTTAAYPTKITGKSTGDTLTNAITYSKTATSTVLGTLTSALTTSFANGTLINGDQKIFSFKVTAPSSNNLDTDGTGLGLHLATTTFTVASSGNIALSGFQVQRVGGANGKVALTSKSLLHAGGSTFGVGWQNAYGTMVDGTVKPGETVEYEIWATVNAVNSSASLQVKIGDLATFYYYHMTGASTQTADYYPIISGISDVIGGTLSKS